jgi:hypothetical protein
MIKIFSFLLALLSLAVNLEAAESVQLVLNADVNSKLTTPDGRSQSLTGRVSTYLTRQTGQSSETGYMVNAMNIVYFGVPQAMLSGREARGKPTGVLGFSLTMGKVPQLLTLDLKSNEFRGTLRGQLDYPQLFDLTKVKTDPKLDDIDVPTQPAKVTVRIKPSKAIKQPTETKSMVQMEAKIDLEIDAAALKLYDLNGYKIVTKEAFAHVDVAFRPWWEVAKRLCLQPVAIARERYLTPELPPITIAISGSGLDFGIVGANSEWNKADIVFEVRDWNLVHDVSYSTLTEDEESDLLAEVDVDDCIEIFFVNRFEPSENHGGGVTFSGGGANSKIISSDENAFFGVDLTHLAHELGHVMTFKHPGAGYPTAAQPHRVDGSAGTLMCPSGFRNDNPQRNSQWNADKASNPLFTFAFKALSVGPDCSHSEDTGGYVDDCGNCPEL